MSGREWKPGDVALIEVGCHLHHALAKIARRSTRDLGPHMIGAAMRQAVAENA